MIKLIIVKLYKGEIIDHALKRLRRRIQKEGTLQDLFERRFYKSEGQKRREVRRRAEYLNSFKNSAN